MKQEETRDIKNLFFIELLNKVKILKENGLNFCLSGFRDEETFVSVDIFIGGCEKRFNFFFDGEILSLSNEEYKQLNKSFPFEEMATHLFILLNGGPIAGVLELSQNEPVSSLTSSCLTEASCSLAV